MYCNTDLNRCVILSRGQRVELDPAAVNERGPKQLEDEQGDAYRRQRVKHLQNVNGHYYMSHVFMQHVRTVRLG